MAHSAAAAAFAALTTLLALPSAASGQTTCSGQHQSALTGTVRDSTQALIPGATVTLDGGQHTVSGSDGRFRFACVRGGSHTLLATAEGFAEHEVSVSLPSGNEFKVLLEPASVRTDVEVSAEADSLADPSASGASPTISGKQLQSLAEDPDDLLRELQQLGAASGGNPANTTIAVDGFQGSSKLPPKSSIAYIKVNPDMFSAEFREPPFNGGRVEVYTKPGQPAFHGALFATNGSPWENARDPFSVSKAPLGKQRYGFELTGPVTKKNSDFALDLEHRAISNYGVVNAITLDGNGQPSNAIANVPTPQALWVGQARLDWQLGAKNTLITTYSANVNNLQNVSVGGTNLAETGYNSGQYEHTLRFTDVTTASPHLMHEARVSLRWDGENDTPVSTAPQVQVAGAFIGGGSTLGPQQLHEFNLEADDDAILTTKAHTLKFGTQFMLYHEQQQLTTNFNGAYTFGGGTAPLLDANNQAVPGQTATITGLEQYRRALLKLPGGTPTAYSSVSGTPAVNFSQVQNALYLQDDWDVGHGVHVATGLRYYVQNDPRVLQSLTPRAGVLWSPTKKGTWTLHAHAGLFAGRFGADEYAELQREDGTTRVTRTVYNPVFGDPFTGTAPIFSQRTLAGGLSNATFSIENVGGTRALPHGWNLSLDYYIARIWNEGRSVNVNSPLNGLPNGPRSAGIPNANVYQVQNSGQGRANVTFVGLEQHTLKHVQFFVGGVRVNLVDDSDDNTFATPQSAFSDAGEYAHRSNQPVWNVFGNASITLPKKIIVSGDLNADGVSHYNIVTGFDNNGDGAFNDRPQYAAPGTPLCSAGSTISNCAEPTRFGNLVSTGGVGVFPRNKGVYPWRFYLDTNIERAFTLTHNAKAEHQQTLTVNVRSSNVLNHTNVTAVGGVLGSPLFGVAYAADNGRRVEAGLRYSF